MLWDEGLEESDEEAFKWYAIAAENGCYAAQIRLAEIYEDELEESYPEEVKKWNLMAEKTGDTTSQAILDTIEKASR